MNPRFPNKLEAPPTDAELLREAAKWSPTTPPASIPDRLDDVKKWDFAAAEQSTDTALRRAVADIKWLVGEVEHLRQALHDARERARRLDELYEAACEDIGDLQAAAKEKP